MSKETLQALTVEMLLVGASANTIKNLWSAIQHRHDMAGLPAPLTVARSFQKLFKAVASITGTPGQIQVPVGTHHIQQWFDLVGLSRLELWSVLVTILGTACCSRPAEVSNMQLCDLLGDTAVHSTSCWLEAWPYASTSASRIRAGLGYTYVSPTRSW
jgi:hypothetical protein